MPCLSKPMGKTDQIKKKMKRKLSVLFTVLALCGISYLIASPYFAIDKLNTALMIRDQAAFNELVDHESLRRSVKPILRAQTKKFSEVQEADGAVLSFGKTLGNVFFQEQIERAQEMINEKALDKLTTPEGFAQLLLSGGLTIKDLNKIPVSLRMKSSIVQGASRC